jgi:hypothetical protein
MIEWVCSWNLCEVWPSCSSARDAGICRRRARRHGFHAWRSSDGLHARDASRERIRFSGNARFPRSADARLADARYDGAADCALHLPDADGTDGRSDADGIFAADAAPESDADGTDCRSDADGTSAADCRPTDADGTDGRSDADGTSAADCRPRDAEATDGRSDADDGRTGTTANV